MSSAPTRFSQDDRLSLFRLQNASLPFERARSPLPRRAAPFFSTSTSAALLLGVRVHLLGCIGTICVFGHHAFFPLPFPAAVKASRNSTKVACGDRLSSPFFNPPTPTLATIVGFFLAEGWRLGDSAQGRRTPPLSSGGWKTRPFLFRAVRDETELWYGGCALPKSLR